MTGVFTGGSARVRRVSWRRSVNLLALGVFVAQVAFSMAAPLLPVYLAELGLERNLALWSGAIFSISFVTFGIMSPVWGSISDRYGKRPMILRAGLGMGLTYALMAVARDHVQLFLLRAINGALSGYIPAAITLATTLAPEPSLGWALGMIQSANAVGLITGPLIGGLVAGAVGIKASFVFAAVLLVLAALVPLFGVSESPA
ncbi:MAG TPA: multidrug efflux MFS transporter, partial [Firmicutes bacterium]|nr:multidrug efflux MFS transporter [Bacillota bacterium]